MSDSKSSSIAPVATPVFSASTLLGVLFVGLKLTGFISWSWLWVTAPFWIGTVIFLTVLLVVALVLLGLWAFSAWESYRARVSRSKPSR